MRIRIILASILLIISFYSYPQQNTGDFSILFYNVENLFDVKDDSLTEDDEFTPAGERHWTLNRLNNKLLHLSKVILNSSGFEVPAIVALCEIENREVLESLIHKTPLKSKSYRIIQKESPDHRGIDVALLYDAGKFYPLTYKHYPLKTKNGSIKKTREILYVSGILNGKDTVHLFVNHWPSRYGGLLETKPERNKAAALLRQKVDELFDRVINPNIIVLGDFNDQPDDESLAKILNANCLGPLLNENELYNLSYEWLHKEEGTLKYRSQWSVFDQIIVSGVLLKGTSKLVVKTENASIVNLPFLYEKDEKYGGRKPKRTYYGYTYQGGFSDHLPILLKVEAVD